MNEELEKLSEEYINTRIEYMNKHNIYTDRQIKNLRKKFSDNISDMIKRQGVEFTKDFLSGDNDLKTQ